MTNILDTGFNTLYIFAGMVLIEFIIFLIIVAKKKLNIIRILFAVLAGNAFTTVLCLFLPTGNGLAEWYTNLGITFLVSVVFEWLFDVAFFRNSEYTTSKLTFLACSVMGNLLSFAGIAVLAHYGLLNR